MKIYTHRANTWLVPIYRNHKDLLRIIYAYLLYTDDSLFTLYTYQFKYDQRSALACLCFDSFTARSDPYIAIGGLDLRDNMNKSKIRIINGKESIPIYLYFRSKKHKNYLFKLGSLRGLGFDSSSFTMNKLQIMVDNYYGFE